MLRLYNSLSRRDEPFAPLRDNTVRMYACGLTVYNRGHIGNFRTFIFGDILRRRHEYDVGGAQFLLRCGGRRLRPEARRNEMLALLASGLEDISISRETFRWGIPFPKILTPFVSGVECFGGAMLLTKG